MIKHHGGDGWIRDDDQVEQVVARLYARGIPVEASAISTISGEWSRMTSRGATGIFAQDAEYAVLGRHLPAMTQQRGRCVSLGTGRAIQDSLYMAIMAGKLSKPVQIATEPIYGGARVEVGRGQIEGDGAVGAWAAEFVAKYGVCCRDRFGQYDLSTDQEWAAVAFGDHGVPDEVLRESRSHLVSAHRCRSTDDIADCIAAGYPIAICGSTVREHPNGNGIAAGETAGNHCTELCGVCLDAKGQLLFVEQQSWGDYPGPVTLRWAGGSKPLRQGSFGVSANMIERVLRYGGEAWAFAIGEGWIGSLSEMTIGGC